jgi:hypothetical protein
MACEFTDGVAPFLFPPQRRLGLEGRRARQGCRLRKGGSTIYWFSSFRGSDRLESQRSRSVHPPAPQHLMRPSEKNPPEFRPGGFNFSRPRNAALASPRLSATQPLGSCDPPQPDATGTQHAAGIALRNQRENSSAPSTDFTIEMVASIRATGPEPPPSPVEAIARFRCG